MDMNARRFRVAEFFAGIGLVRLALEGECFDVVFANDIEPAKRDLYVANFGTEHFVLDDVRNVHGDAIPDVDIATASFPCTDLSLAGMRAGLAGEHSGMFWEFARVLEEMGSRRPRAVLLENVAGFASSRGGEDMRAVLAKLNDLGYSCDVFAMDARWFLPQSRPRLFIVGSVDGGPAPRFAVSSRLRTPRLAGFLASHPSLRVHAHPLPPPPTSKKTLASMVEHLSLDDERWWTDERREAFVDSLSSIQAARLSGMKRQAKPTWATAYRRTRRGSPVWEIRPDSVSGCLRTARGGSSKQAIVEAGGGDVRVRWMTPREYARLQGAPAFKIKAARDSSVLFGFGDAVCVPVVAWIARNYLRPLLTGAFTAAADEDSLPPCPRETFRLTSPQFAPPSRRSSATSSTTPPCNTARRGA